MLLVFTVTIDAELSGVFYSAPLIVVFAQEYFGPQKLLQHQHTLSQKNQGRFLGFWLSFRVLGQIIGDAINLGMNVHDNSAGKVSFSVFQAFIAHQAIAPLTALLLSRPHKVQRPAMSISISKSAAAPVIIAYQFVDGVFVRLVRLRAPGMRLKQTPNFLFEKTSYLSSLLLPKRCTPKPSCSRFNPYGSLSALEHSGLSYRAQLQLPPAIFQTTTQTTRNQLENQITGAFFAITVLQGGFGAPYWLLTFINHN